MASPIQRKESVSVRDIASTKMRKILTEKGEGIKDEKKSNRAIGRLGKRG